MCYNTAYTELWVLPLAFYAFEPMFRRSYRVPGYGIGVARHFQVVWWMEVTDVPKSALVLFVVYNPLRTVHRDRQPTTCYRRTWKEVTAVGAGDERKVFETPGRAQPFPKTVTLHYGFQPLETFFTPTLLPSCPIT